MIQASKLRRVQCMLLLLTGLVLTGSPATAWAAVKGFGLAGADGKFVWADAVIDGDDVIDSSEQIASPVSVNYGWDINPDASLFNKAELPAASFTTANY